MRVKPLFRDGVLITFINLRFVLGRLDPLFQTAAAVADGGKKGAETHAANWAFHRTGCVFHRTGQARKKSGDQPVLRRGEVAGWCEAPR